MDEIRWSRMPFGLLDSTGLCRIQKATAEEHGFNGYKLYVGGEHVKTRVRLKDAKADAAEYIRGVL